MAKFQRSFDTMIYKHYIDHWAKKLTRNSFLYVKEIDGKFFFLQLELLSNTSFRIGPIQGIYYIII